MLSVIFYMNCNSNKSSKMNFDDPQLLKKLSVFSSHQKEKKAKNLEINFDLKEDSVG